MPYQDRVGTAANCLLSGSPRLVLAAIVDKNKLQVVFGFVNRLLARGAYLPSTESMFLRCNKE